MEEDKRKMGKAMKGRRGGTKRKIALDKKREKESTVEVTFSKRRKTLFRKAEKLCQVLPQTSHPVSVAAIVFSPHGKPYVFGSHADPDSFFDSFLRDTNHHQAITCVDDHDTFIISPPPPPSPWSSSIDSSSCCSGSGSGSGGTPSFAVPMQMRMEMNVNNTNSTTRKEEWLSLEGCDTLDKMVAKRDHLLTILQLIQHRMSDSSPSSSTATPPTSLVVPPIQTVVTNPTDHSLMTCMGEELPSQTRDSTASTSTTTEDGTTTTTTPGHVEEDSDHPDDFWNRLMTLEDDDVYLNIDSFLC